MVSVVFRALTACRIAIGRATWIRIRRRHRIVAITAGNSCNPYLDGIAPLILGLAFMLRLGRIFLHGIPPESFRRQVEKLPCASGIHELPQRRPPPAVSF